MTPLEQCKIIEARSNGLSIERRLTERGIALGQFLYDHRNDLRMGIILADDSIVVLVHELRNWFNHDTSEFNFSYYDYRIKPEPPKPREWWLNIYGNDIDEVAMHATAESAERGREGSEADCVCVHVREVLPDDGMEEK